MSDVTWKVYVQNWTIAYTSDARGDDGKAECESVLAERWGGRVEPEDTQVAAVGIIYPDKYSYLIWLRLPQLAGEWKTEQQARDQADRLWKSEKLSPPFAGRLAGQPEVVQSGSPEERALLDYGKRMLPA